MKTKFSTFCRYAVEFSLCSLCGWVYEALLELLVYGRYTDRGMLHLPVCPIYGFAGFALLFLFRSRRSWLTVFAGSVLLPTVLELVSYAPLEKIAGYPLWDYSAWLWNYRGIISLPSSLLFGVMGLLLVKGIHPLMDLVHRKMPEKWLCIAGILCTGTLLTDAVLTFFLQK